MPTTFRYRSRHGFTLVETIVVVVLLGLLINAGVSYMRDTSTTGRTNVLATNANELNKAIVSLQASGASFTIGAISITNGSATAGATILLPPGPLTGAVALFVNQLTGAGISSYGNTVSIARPITAASYTYTWTNGRPVFSVVSGATVP